MSTKTFLKGAAILGIAGVIVQIMGAVFRIPLGNIIGDEGMGYYQTAYPIYIFLLVFSTNGAPAAISKMTSERIAIGNKEEAYRVFQLSFIVMLALGVIASSVIFFGAKPIVTALKSPGAYYSMMAIAPALLFVPMMAVFRGYFQGLQEMKPTALSQIIEQAIRVAVGLSLAVALISVGTEYAAAGASFGTSIGPIAGTIALIFVFMKKKKRLKQEMRLDTVHEREKASKIIKELTLIAVPITIGVSILPIMNIVDVAIVIRRLQEVGLTYEASNALYGQLTGMAGPIINIPQALALSIALSLVPAIAASKSINDEAGLKQNIQLGFRTVMIVGIPCMLGLMAIAEPLMLLLYPMQAESAINAAPSLFYLAIGVIFIVIAQAMAGILQGLGKPMIAVWSLGAGVIVKVIATYILVGVPELNIQGAAIGSSLAYAVVGFLNFYFVKKYTNTHFNFHISVVRPVVSGAVMYLVVVLVYKGGSILISDNLATACSVAVGAMVYVAMLIFTKAIREDEIKLFPKGEKIHKLLSKIRLIK